MGALIMSSGPTMVTLQLDGGGNGVMNLLIDSDETKSGTVLLSGSHLRSVNMLVTLSL